MKNSKHSFFQKFRDHPVFDAGNLFQKMWKGPFIVGHIDEVFVPTEEELFALFKYWYRATQVEQRHIQSVDQLRDIDYAFRRLNLIYEFLPEKEADALIKQLPEIQQKMRASDEEESQPPQDFPF